MQVFAVSPDGHWLVQAESPWNGIKSYGVLWDARTGQLQPRQLWPDSGRFSPLFFSRDGRMLGLTNELWDVSTRAVRTLERPAIGEDGNLCTTFVYAFTPDSQRVLVSCASKIYLFDTTTGKPALTFVKPRGFESYEASVPQLSPDGRFVATDLTDGATGQSVTGVWDVPTGTFKYTLPRPKECWGVVLRWSSDSHLLLTQEIKPRVNPGQCKEEGRLRLWSIR
jgi:WD40 repeat protein